MSIILLFRITHFFLQLYNTILFRFKRLKQYKNETKFTAGILEEAKYYGLEHMIPELEHIINFGARSRDTNPLSRRDVINGLMSTTIESQLRFQGVNLEGADLSRLDLRNLNLKVSVSHSLRL